MRKYIFLFLLIFFAENIFSQNVTLIDEKNVYGGKTYEIVINEKDIEFEQYSRSINFYDDKNNRIKVVITPSQTVIHEKGIIEQINYFSENIISKYEMFFTEKYQQLHDYNRIIEEVENNVIVKTIWYIDGFVIDIVEYPTEMNKFVFYNVKYLENEFLELYEPNPDPTKDAFLISYKYVSIRSIIKFDTELFELNEKDIEIIRVLLTRFNALEMLSLYTKKVQVSHNNNHYWLYVQKELEEYVNGQEATIKYYPIMLNGKIYLMCVGFYDINRKKPNVT